MLLETTVCPHCSSELRAPIPHSCPVCKEKLLRCVLYARVSTPRQAKLYSLDYQLDEERDYLKLIRGVEVAAFEDDQSGRSTARDGLQDAVRLLEDDQADALITYKIDRLHRNFVNHVLLRQKVQGLKKELHYAQMRRKAGSKAKERLSEDVLALLAEIEADEIVERTQMGLQRKAADGRWVGWNKAPYGFKVDGANPRAARLVCDWGSLDEAARAEFCEGRASAEVVDLLRQGQATAAVILLAYAWYAVLLLSTQQIAERLTLWRVPTPLDLTSRVTTTKRRGFAEWGSGTVSHLLRDPKYNGRYPQFRRVRVSKTVTQARPPSEWQVLAVDLIVPDALWQATQERLAIGRERSARRNATPGKYLVSRLFRCECGYAFRAGMRTGTPRPFYTCGGRFKDAARKCDFPALPATEVDARVWAWVKQEMADPERVRERAEARKGKADEARQRQDAERQEVEVALLALQQEEDRLLDQTLAGMFSQDAIARRTALLQTRRAELEARRAKLQAQGSADTGPLNVSELVLLSASIKERLDYYEDNPAVRRTLIEKLDVQVRARRKDGQVVLGISAAGLPEEEWPLDGPGAFGRGI